MQTHTIFTAETGKDIRSLGPRVSDMFANSILGFGNIRFGYTMTGVDVMALGFKHSGFRVLICDRSIKHSGFRV